jgi:hypothetical protein
VEALAGDEAAQDLGLDGEADGEGGAGDDLAGSADAIDDDGIAGVAFEEVIEVGGAGGGVAAGDEIEDAALGGEDGESAAVLVKEHGEALGGAVVGDEAGDDGSLGIGEGFEATLDSIEKLGATGILFGTGGGGVLGSEEGLLGGALPSSGEGDQGSGGGGGLGLELVEGSGDVLEDGALAVAGREGDDGEEVEGLDPIAPGIEEDGAGEGGGEDGEGEHGGEVYGGLGGLGLGADVGADPAGEGAIWEAREARGTEGDGVWPGPVLGRGLPGEEGEDAIGVLDAGLHEDDGGSAVDGGGVQGGLDELLPGGIEVFDEVWVWGLAAEGGYEEVGWAGRIDGHGGGLVLSDIRLPPSSLPTARAVVTPD